MANPRRARPLCALLLEAGAFPCRAPTQGLLDPRHAFGLAGKALRALRRATAVVGGGGADQSILASGEDGAGKTVTTRVERVLGANPLLEALGDAKTLRNGNS